MIIQCINCNKKFEVNSTLVPDYGRNIQCGACNHTWFYNPSEGKIPELLIVKDISEQIVGIKIADVEKDNSDQIQVTQITEEEENYKSTKSKNKGQKKETSASKKTSKENEIIDNYVETKKTSVNFTLSGILSYFIVGIISFIGIIILLDTFKLPLSDFYPNLELVLYNLFESIKDILLFIKDLFV